MDPRARAAIDEDVGEGPEPLPTEGLPDRYRPLRRLGRGGSAGGALFSAVDARDGVLVAVKRGAAAEPIRREAEILRALDHPNVVRLKEWHEADGAAFLVLEFVDAPDLAAFMARSGDRLDEATLRALLLQLADAVDALHAKGFLHRDLKPANVLVRADGSPVLIDFNAAAPIGRAADAPAPWSTLTEGYAAPEQYATDKAEGPWTDVYGLGAIAYRALTGRPPPPAPARLRGDESLTPTAEAADGCSEALARAVDGALELEPASRPQTIRAWTRALLPAAGQDAAARAAPAGGGIAGGEEELDDRPPTIRVKRAPSRRIAREPAAAPSEAPARRRRRVRAAPLLATGLALAAGLAAAGWYGWPLYERYVKTEWVVDAAGGGDAETIADALSRAGDGATIRVRPGTYAESVVLDRPVHLTAAVAGEAPVIAPDTGPCLTADAEGGSVSALRLQAPAPAEGEAAPAPCLDIADGGLRVEANTIVAATGPAVLVRDGADPLILGNTIEEGAGPGIVVTAGAGGTIAQNTISNVAEAGLVVRSGAEPSVTDNTIENSGGGAVFAEGAAGTFARNRIAASKGSAIVVTTGADPLVADNRIEGAGESGIFVYDLGKGRFEGNTIADSGLSGAVIASGGSPRLAENTIEGSAEHGVLVVDRSGGVLERNTIAGNKGHGIALGWDAEVELTDNKLDGNTEPQLLDARDR